MKKALINLLNKWGCHHKWYLMKEFEVRDELCGTYYKFLFCCEKCGKLKWLRS